MKILIDTNVLIAFEDTTSTISARDARLAELFNSGKYEVCVHPDQIHDIERDKDAGRKEIMLSKLKKYPQLKSPPRPTPKDLSSLGWSDKNENDSIDNLLLFCLHRGSVNFLVTEDRKMHAKAEMSDPLMGQGIHTIDQMINFLQGLRCSDTPVIRPDFSNIQEKSLEHLDRNSPLFDSVRESYPKFDEWFRNSAAIGRKAWCILTPNDTLGAICIYKEEKNEEIKKCGITLLGKVLKLCTFKVGEELRGQKLGEKLLHYSFKYANLNDYKYVYLHTDKTKHQFLETLCLDFGFESVGVNEHEDSVYVKKMIPDAEASVKLSPLNYAIKYYPHYKDSNEIAKFIIPIIPLYHNILFPDVGSRAPSLFENTYLSDNPASNTIKKAYVSNAMTMQIKPGDIVLFYRSRDRKSIECAGVVEVAYRINNKEELFCLVSKRTVYSMEELSKFLEKDHTLVILFRIVELKGIKSISYGKLERAGVKMPIQSTRSISHEQYLKCIENSNQD